MTSGLARTGLGVLLTLAAFLPAGRAEPGDEPRRPLGPEQVLEQTVDNPKAAGSLEDVLAACERQAGRFGRLLVIVDWSELEAAGVTRDARVALAARSATVKQYLDAALQAASPQPGKLGWYRVETTVFVTTQDYIQRNMARISALAASSVGGSKTSAAGGDSPAPARAPAPPPRKAPAGVSFNETPLETVFDYVREVSDVSLHVNWKALEVAGVTKTTPVTVEVKGLTSSRLLDLTVDQLTTGDDKMRKVYWYIEDGIVFVSTGQALNDTPLTSQVFEIGSMTVDAPHFVGPRIDLAKQMQGQNGQGGGNTTLFQTDKNGDNPADGDTNRPLTRAERRKELQEQIVTLLKGTSPKDMWEPEGKGRVTILRDRVIISQTKLGWILMGKQ